MSSERATIDFSVDDRVSCALDADEMQLICDTVLAEEGVRRPCYISVSIVGDEQIRELNAQWRSQDRPTDVLSFECERPDDPELAEGEPCELGDIVLAPQYIANQAKAFGTTEADETRLLLVHGLLHLLGYDHMEESDAQAMERREDDLIRLLPSDHTLSSVVITRHHEEDST